MTQRFLPILVGAVTFALLGHPVAAQINGDTSVTRQPNGGFEAQIFTDRTQYGPNRAVEITFSLTNLMGASAAVAPGRNRAYTYVVRDSRSNRVIYDMARHRPFNPESFSIPVGENRTSRELWDQRDDQGSAVGRGVYIIEAKIWPQNVISTQVFLTSQDGPQRPQSPGRPRPTNPDPNMPDPINPTPVNPVNGGLHATLSAGPLPVAPGQTVSLTYTIANVGASPISLSFRSGKQFDMEGSGPGGKKMWQQSDGMGYTQALTQLTLQPGTKREYKATWTIPATAAPGIYNVIAYLTPAPTGRTQTPIGFCKMDVIVKGNGNGPGNTSVQPPHPRVVTLQTLINEGNAAVGQRVTVTGTFSGLSGNVEAAPYGISEWSLTSEGVSMPVYGPPPGGPRPGRTVTVTGTVRRTANGKLRIETP